jgi:His-Xaa-Ser repeat protein HxsA
MKKIKLLILTSTALIGLGSPAWAGPHGGGGGFGGGHFGGFAGGGSRAAPALSGGGARFSGNRSIGGLSRTPQQFYYYDGNRMSGLRQPAFVRPPPSRSVTANAASRPTIARPQNPAESLARQNNRVANSQVTATNRQPNRIGSNGRQNRVSDLRTSTAANRQSFVKNHASERHDGNWHRDWDKHRAHFHHNRVFVFIDGFWWGLDSGYYPWADNPYYDYGYPDGYDDSYPYSYYDPSYPSGNDDQSSYAGSQQSVANAMVSAVQSQLAKLGYYNGAIDGSLGDQTEAALSRYQEDNDLSVTGTVDSATLQSLGLR